MYSITVLAMEVFQSITNYQLICWYASTNLFHQTYESMLNSCAIAIILSQTYKNRTKYLNIKLQKPGQTSWFNMLFQRIYFY